MFLYGELFALLFGAFAIGCALGLVGVRRLFGATAPEPVGVDSDTTEAGRP